MEQKFIAKKDNGKLLFKDLGGIDNKNSSTMWCMYEADKVHNWNSFKQIKISTNEVSTDINEYSPCKENSYVNLIPDFSFHNYPKIGITDYEQYVNEIHNSGMIKFEKDRVGWIGDVTSSSNRQTLVNIANSNKHMFEIVDTQSLADNDKEQIGSINDLVKKYSILLDIEGSTYSLKLKFLLWSGRPILLVDRPYKEYYFEYLKPWVHYIPVKRDLSDLTNKVDWCLTNYDKAVKIGSNAYEFAKQYLSREGSYAQWDKLIKAYA